MSATIKRYAQLCVRPSAYDPFGGVRAEEADVGDWVKYEDHVAALATANPVTTKQAKNQLVSAAGDVGENANSLDATADALLTRVAQFFGECVGGSTFCGLGIDEARDENGVLQYLRLVPCDLVNGEPARRVAK